MDAASGGAAVWWWVGVIALFLVVAPVLVYLAHRLLAHIIEIHRYADDVRDNGAAITKNLEPIPVLAETRDLVKRLGTALGRYVRAVDGML